ncbi:phage portal protein [Ligilactobacillus salivarius]|uniref:phage portal protein n=1 Tax=Ligilactobacillus salivarius TaxID=1624 RepID=UPI002105B83A|nr:phage portal protein [Ligilactobacillus salivarius]
MFDYFLREFEQQIGFSSGTFSYDDQGVKTATEVVSENSTTYQTRSSYLTQVELFLNQLVNVILEVASVGQFFSDGKPRWTGNVEDVELSVHFDDGVFIDKDKQRADEMQLVAAGIMPKLEYLKRNFGLSEEDAQKWLAQVNNEQPDFSQGAFQEPIDGDSNEV